MSGWQDGLRRSVSAGDRYRGRGFEDTVEHVASAKATRLQSLDELLRLIASMLTEVRNTEKAWSLQHRLS